MTDAVDLAREWVSHRERFGILAEISNGVYSADQCYAIAETVLAQHARIATLEVALREACSRATTHLPEDRERILELRKLADVTS